MPKAIHSFITDCISALIYYLIYLRNLIFDIVTRQSRGAASKISRRSSVTHTMAPKKSPIWAFLEAIGAVTAGNQKSKCKGCGKVATQTYGLQLIREYISQFWSIHSFIINIGINLLLIEHPCHHVTQPSQPITWLSPRMQGDTYKIPWPDQDLRPAQLNLQTSESFPNSAQTGQTHSRDIRTLCPSSVEPVAVFISRCKASIISRSQANEVLISCQLSTLQSVWEGRLHTACVVLVWSTSEAQD